MSKVHCTLYQPLMIAGVSSHIPFQSCSRRHRAQFRSRDNKPQQCRAMLTHQSHSDSKGWDILGLGQAMVDFSAAVEDNFLEDLGLEKGGRRLVHFFLPTPCQIQSWPVLQMRNCYHPIMGTCNCSTGGKPYRHLIPAQNYHPRGAHSSVGVAGWTVPGRTSWP